MLRQMIKIDEHACTGCGLCVSACHEGALVMQDGKARLIRDDYCDGLGNCLPACPASAISFEMREAVAYDEEAVQRHLAARAQNVAEWGGGPRCPGVQAQSLQPLNTANAPAPAGLSAPAISTGSELRQWPVQIKLAPVNAPYFREADILIAADCTAFSCGDFHSRFMRGRVTLIGCTKLDNVDYSDKLAEIFRLNDVKSVTVARMDVPCCGGMEHTVSAAIRKSGRDIPCVVTVIGRDGQSLKSEPLRSEAAPLLRTLS